MATTQSRALIASIKQMQALFSQLIDLLIKDKKDIAKNNIGAVQNNNNEKTILLNNISHLMAEYNALSPSHEDKSFFEIIEQAAVDFNEAEKNEVAKFAGELKSEIAECYKHLITNSKIVNANLQQLKTFWDKLMSSTAKSNCTYDNLGNITK